ncbi:glutathione S-transferase [Pseudomonas sp. MAFF212428]|uniref:Glutathione S-transferase n=1 Tax=Pseudomonas brassicae TaxID=2708063 RepID=A0A6B3NTB2_9PSED|nr:glutathione S-transferase [Pseudomonas brassicae]NER61437.1 glutathione S-transferase [Pseudomonas brassicae]NER66495.1 glutathione S-transferase [Pseudomonas brassicae]
MILYSFRRCPYAMRARMALRYAGCAVQVCEVSLKAKPAEMLALSPKGTVPVLSVDGRVLDESMQIMRWALARHDPQDWLLSTDPAAAQAAQALIERNDTLFKVQLNHYKYAERYPEQTREQYRALAEAVLLDLEQRLGEQAYLLAAQPSIADVALMPFIRQFAGVEPEWFAQAPYPHLRTWLQSWLDSPLFKAIMAR